MKYLVSLSTGTSNSHQRVKPDNLLEIPIPKFDDALIGKFNTLTIPFIKEIKLKREEEVLLITMKTHLLSKLVNIDN